MSTHIQITRLQKVLNYLVSLAIDRFTHLMGLAIDRVMSTEQHSCVCIVQLH